MVQWCHLPPLHSIAQLLRWAGRFKRKDTIASSQSNCLRRMDTDAAWLRPGERFPGNPPPDVRIQASMGEAGETPGTGVMVKQKKESMLRGQSQEVHMNLLS